VTQIIVTAIRRVLLSYMGIRSFPGNSPGHFPGAPLLYETTGHYLPEHFTGHFLQIAPGKRYNKKQFWGKNTIISVTNGETICRKQKETKKCSYVMNI